ncbi:agmatinase [Lachancea thermotolerans CBS 6340]|uniref:KLTH0C07502p n=1 Tax=Lachancea thermotolerans (strain ATCC 56472 / CBS 6340 / NRRL Y-8284) TaxID=559295 RepID=C5DEA1_LACTC|nr:KLTH0C07502p [Lachancea thermotolerans CBS 6340]CAR22112.1 KLTH0C07502p [Lachancea thermotolerans CBS 6340]
MKVTWVGCLTSLAGSSLAYVISDQGHFSNHRTDLLDQVFGEVLASHDGSGAAEVRQRSFNLDEDEDPEFKAMCGFYQEHPVEFPDDDLSNDLELFAGIVSFAHVPIERCFGSRTDGKSPLYDIAIVGAPFDTSVSYRPGARFGPNAVRQGSRRLGGGILPVRGFPGSKLRKLDPYNAGYKIVDCGDVPMTPYDNRIALNQLYRGQRAIYNKTTLKSDLKAPKVITLGGDHTVTLMALKAASEHNGPLAVVHFDSHIDTWDPKVLGGGITKTQSINHGTFLHFAHERGYIARDKSMHVGIRAPFIAPTDDKHDRECGFQKIVARDFDILGFQEIVSQIKQRVGDLPVYITVDIDVLDLSVAPGTGTPEPGGLTSRELLTVLDGLEGLNVVGADVVEVSPAFDTNGDITSIVAAQVIDSILGLMTVG